jgi:ketosteroid isomerase-like protein
LLQAAPRAPTHAPARSDYPNQASKEQVMTLKSIGTQLVEMCNAGKNFELMRTMYSPDIVSVEATGEETAGQPAVIQKSERWQSQNTIHRQTVRGPFLHGPDHFAAHFSFDVTPKATGKQVTLEEVAIYTVKDSKITREEFFYDGVR